MTKQNTPTVEEKDLVVAFLAKLVGFCKKNKQGVLTALVILVLAGALGVAYNAHAKKVAENSWAGYYTAQVALLSGNQEQAFAQVDALNKEYKGSDAAQYAQLLKADTLYNAENFAQAADVYEPLLNAKNTTVRTVAALSLAASRQAVQEYQKAADGLNEFIAQNPKSFALPQAYLTLAMSQELAGDTATAVTNYKYLVENYNNTYFSAVAKEKLAQLQK